MSDPDRPSPSPADVGGRPGEGFALASEAPLARGAVIAAVSGVVFGFTFLPQLLSLALAGLSLARRETSGHRYVALAVGLSLFLTVAWAVVLGLLLRWWASTRVA